MHIASKIEDLPQRPAAEPLQRLNRRFREIRVLIRRLRHAATRGAVPERARAFEQVRLLLDQSFAAEERLMTALTYWGFRQHRADHEQIRARLAEFEGAGAQPDGDWGQGIGALLEEFIVHHYSFDAVFLPDRAPPDAAARGGRAGAPGQERH